MLVKIKPISQRARNRVREHGEIMSLELTEGADKIMCRSLGATWHGATWLGWFSTDDCQWERFEESVL